MFLLRGLPSSPVKKLLPLMLPPEPVPGRNSSRRRLPTPAVARPSRPDPAGGLPPHQYMVWPPVDRPVAASHVAQLHARHGFPLWAPRPSIPSIPSSPASLHSPVAASRLRRLRSAVPRLRSIFHYFGWVS
jgi:hypothetical protein